MTFGFSDFRLLPAGSTTPRHAHRSPMPSRPPRFLAFFLLTGLPLIAAPAATPSDPWAQASLGLFKDAHRAFSEAPAADREARFGEAVALLNVQPKTDANLDHAAALFRALVADDPADDYAIGARYFLARIPHVHRATPDAALALAGYRELAALDSPHPLAQRAVVLVALLELFEPGISAEERVARFERLSARGAALVDSSARRDFHLVMAEAALRHKFDDRITLEHLLAADRAGIVRAVTQRDTWLRTAEIARRAGRPDVAIASYRRFLENFRSDPRRRAIQEHLAELLPSSASSVP